MLNPKLTSYLESLYYDPKNAGSFGGPRALYKAVKSAGQRIISMGKIKKWLKSQWDVDLMDMDYYSKHKMECVMCYWSYSIQFNLFHEQKHVQKF